MSFEVNCAHSVYVCHPLHYMRLALALDLDPITRDPCGFALSCRVTLGPSIWCLARLWPRVCSRAKNETGDAHAA
jgi:hypothetical protein